jgi:recombination protein RecA
MAVAATKKKGGGGLMMAALDAAKKVLKTESFLVALNPDSYKTSLPHVPTGSFVIDYLIGGEPNVNGVPPCPGLPRGKVTQVWGAESSGKSTLAQTAAATVCKAGGTCLYVDFENAIVPDYAAALGVPIDDPSRFQLVQPTSLEDGLKLIKIYTLAGVDLIIIDSVGAAVPSAVVERSVKDMDDPVQVGFAARMWSNFLPAIRSDLIKHNTALMGISQTRAKIGGGGAGYGPQTEAQGGNAWKYFADLRISLRRVEQEKAKTMNHLTHKVEERITGGKFEGKVEKSKVSKSQGRKENFYITWGLGIDDLRSLVEIAVSHNIVKKSGGWYMYGDTLKFQGSDQLVKKFRSDASLFNDLVSKVRPLLAATMEAVADDAELPDFDSDESIEALLNFEIPPSEGDSE